MNYAASLLILLLAIAEPLEAQDAPSPEQIETMVNRYVLGMEGMARKLLLDTGLEQSDIDRIASEFSSKIRSCIYASFSEEESTSVEISNEAVEACTNEAFENAGIVSPFAAA